MSLWSGKKSKQKYLVLEWVIYSIVFDHVLTSSRNVSGRAEKVVLISMISGRGRKSLGVCALRAPPCLAPLININMYTYLHTYNHSLTGVTSFLFGDVRFLTLDQWVSEYRNFEKLRTIPFFHRFKKTKSFQTWKRVVKRQKFISASQKL